MSEEFSRLIELIAHLRGEQGCPWDREQTRESIKPLLLEEVYEVLEAIEGESPAQLKEELGDLLLQVVFHSQIAKEDSEFDISDVLTICINKLVRRHPHVFGDRKLDGTREVLQQWEEIKRQERAEKAGGQGASDSDVSSLWATLPKALPALLWAYQVQERASRVGFDWPAFAWDEPGKTGGTLKVEGGAGIWEKVQEELEELQEAVRLGDRVRIEEELGDVLFTLVNFARLSKIEAEGALRRATRRFMDRFKKMEALAQGCGKSLQELSLKEMDALWGQAKGLER